MPHTHKIKFSCSEMLGCHCTTHKKKKEIEFGIAPHAFNINLHYFFSICYGNNILSFVLFSAEFYRMVVE